MKQTAKDKKEQERQQLKNDWIKRLEEIDRRAVTNVFRSLWITRKK